MIKPSSWLSLPLLLQREQLKPRQGRNWLQFYGKLCWKCSRALWYWWQLKWSLQWLYEKFVLTANAVRTWDIDCWMIGLLLHFKRVVTFPPMFPGTSGIQLPFKQNLSLKLYELLYRALSLKRYGTPCLGLISKAGTHCKAEAESMEEQTSVLSLKDNSSF